MKWMKKKKSNNTTSELHITLEKAKYWLHLHMPNPNCTMLQELPKSGQLANYQQKCLASQKQQWYWILCGIKTYRQKRIFITRQEFKAHTTQWSSVMKSCENLFMTFSKLDSCQWTISSVWQWILSWLIRTDISERSLHSTDIYYRWKKIQSKRNEVVALYIINHVLLMQQWKQ